MNPESINNAWYPRVGGVSSSSTEERERRDTSPRSRSTMDDIDAEGWAEDIEGRLGRTAFRSNRCCSANFRNE